ncbi:MAG: tRNA (guanine37-N1)-methyltransferase [Patescibacteria group bacterium]|jgi:tRNA (guanine37-N1)-methyltransferase|nr:tRNA (guanine37-N1)-methyltransferase [Patescibacteria group bacterium]
MTITFFTLFPEYFDSVLQTSILKRAQEHASVTFECWNIRDYATDKHKVTDDRPYGGGAGMVLKVEPLTKAILAWQEKYQGQKNYVVATAASGNVFTQQKAATLKDYANLAIVCGHYEGIDQRVLDNLVDEEIRIGDYVLTGGEPAAAVITDAIVRLIPGVVGNEQSIQGESHELEGSGNYPQYTRPAEFNGWQVPQVLQQGNHQEIRDWREANRKKIPD